MRTLTITALLATVFFSMSSHAQDVRSFDRLKQEEGERRPSGM